MNSVEMLIELFGAVFQFDVDTEKSHLKLPKITLWIIGMANRIHIGYAFVCCLKWTKWSVALTHNQKDTRNQVPYFKQKSIFKKFLGVSQIQPNYESICLNGLFEFYTYCSLWNYIAVSYFSVYNKPIIFFLLQEMNAEHIMNVFICFWFFNHWHRVIIIVNSVTYIEYSSYSVTVRKQKEKFVYYVQV